VKSSLLILTSFRKAARLDVRVGSDSTKRNFSAEGPPCCFRMLDTDHSITQEQEGEGLRQSHDL
jgi:hypothetical protein